MAKTKKINNKSSDATQKHYFQWLHVIDLVIVLIIIYFVLCETKAIPSGSWCNILIGDFYNKLTSRFECTLYNFSADVNSSLLDGEEFVSSGIDGVVEIASECTTLEMVNQVVIVLLPLLVTILTLSFAILPQKVYGVPYADLRRIGCNRTYTFIGMILLSVCLFVLDIVFFYTSLIFCSLLIDLVAVFYIVFFLILEIPLLSQDSNRVYRIIRNAVKREFINEENFTDKKTLELVVSNIVDRVGLNTAYEYLASGDRYNKYEFSEQLIDIYSANIFTTYYDGIITESGIKKYLEAYNDFFNIISELKVEFYNREIQISTHAQKLWELIQAVESQNNVLSESTYKQIIKLLDSCKENYSIIEDGNYQLYDVGSLYKLSILNILVIFTIRAYDESFLRYFLNLFEGCHSIFGTNPNVSYFLFLSFYLYDIYKDEGASKRYKDMYKRLTKGKEHKETLKELLRLNPKKSISSYEAALILKCFLTIYNTVSIEPSFSMMSWTYLPDDFSSFTPLSINDIYDWWLNLIFTANIDKPDMLKHNLEMMLSLNEIEGLLTNFHGWKDDGKLMAKPKFNEYFTSLGVDLNLESENNKALANSLNELGPKAIADASNKENDTGDNNGNSGGGSTPNENLTNTENETSASEENESKISEEINDHAKKFVYYSETKPESKKDINIFNLTLFYLVDEHHTIDGFESRDKVIDKYFSEDSIDSFYSTYLYQYMNNNLTQSSQFNGKGPSYSKEIINEINKFKPTEKYTPYMKWMKDPEVKSESSLYRTILQTPDVLPWVRLKGDTYLQNDAIKLYINCTEVKCSAPLNKDEVGALIDDSIIKYPQNTEGKYRYLYRDRNYAFESYLTKDVLVNLLDGKICKMTVTIELGVTIDSNKILIFDTKVG